MSREHHPVADLFPMLPDDELKDLAADIRERGLLQAIVLDSQGRILDGRNRYAACELASVEPDFETYDGDDPDGYALAVNANRRDLSKGQKALVAAQAHSFKLKDYGNQVKLARVLGVPEARISQAKDIITYAEDHKFSVLDGASTFDAAYKIALERKKDASTRESRMAKLREEAPDLADKVADGQISLADAEEQHQARINNARSAARSLGRNLDELKDAALRLRTTQLDGRLALAFANGEKPIRPQDVTAIAPDLKKTVSTLNEIAEHLEGITDA